MIRTLLIAAAIAAPLALPALAETPAQNPGAATDARPAMTGQPVQ